MSDQIIPLTADPNQAMQVTVSVDGGSKTLDLFISYNEKATYWTMDITDSVTNESLLTGIPLVTGQYPSANMLGQFAYLGIGSAYVIPTASTSADWPDDTNLGTEFVLVWSDTPDV